jgi:hypothetical protein
VRGWLGCVIAAGAGAAVMAGARAEIYTCVDAKGHRLTSDRPIIECLDREQTELAPNGLPIRKIGPSQTAEERAAEEEKAKRALEERNRQAEEKRRDRALLSRYPDQATHDKERNQALAAIDDVIHSAMKRNEELRAERRKLEAELEFYKGGNAKVPANLKRKLDENEQQVAAQHRFIANQDDEKKRVNARYDEELARLRPLWGERGASATVTRASSSAAR